MLSFSWLQSDTNIWINEKVKDGGMNLVSSVFGL